MTQQPIPGAAVPPVWDPLEREWQTQVIQAAHLLGWIVAHFRPAMTKHGWRTPAGADGAGWPDLVLVGRGQILYRELKTNRGRLSMDQQAWGDWITANGGDWGVWRPRDLRTVVMPELGAKVTA